MEQETALEKVQGHLQSVRGFIENEDVSPLTKGVAGLAVMALGVLAYTQGLDERRNKHETEQVKERVAIVKDLMDSGMSPEDAEKMVSKQFSDLAKRNKEASAIKDFSKVFNLVQN